MTSARTTSSSLADEPRSTSPTEQEHPIAQAGQEAGETAGHLAERAAGVGFQQADRAREQTAQGLNQLADSVRRVSTDMESEQPAIANLASTAAEQAERVAGYLRQTDARQLVQSIEDVARRQPLLFVGGAFVLGVAASRFVKAASGGSDASKASYGGSSYGSAGMGSAGIPDYRGGRFGDTSDEGLRP
ncbi:MAG: hypothetical protein KY392_01840 [Chloroflexi bacterium]|nr:hypothetical protein [Chloroflexota bacterium]